MKILQRRCWRPIISLLALLISSIVISLFSVVQSSILLMYLVVSLSISARYLKKLWSSLKINDSLTSLSETYQCWLEGSSCSDLATGVPAQWCWPDWAGGSGHGPGSAASWRSSGTCTSQPTVNTILTSGGVGMTYPLGSDVGYFGAHQRDEEVEDNDEGGE